MNPPVVWSWTLASKLFHRRSAFEFAAVHFLHSDSVAVCNGDGFGSGRMVGGCTCTARRKRVLTYFRGPRPAWNRAITRIEYATVQQRSFGDTEKAGTGPAALSRSRVICIIWTIGKDETRDRRARQSIEARSAVIFETPRIDEVSNLRVRLTIQAGFEPPATSG